MRRQNRTALLVAVTFLIALVINVGLHGVGVGALLRAAFSPLFLLVLVGSIVYLTLTRGRAQ